MVNVFKEENANNVTETIRSMYAQFSSVISALKNLHYVHFVVSKIGIVVEEKQCFVDIVDIFICLVV